MLALTLGKMRAHGPEKYSIHSSKSWILCSHKVELGSGLRRRVNTYVTSRRVQSIFLRQDSYLAINFAFDEYLPNGGY